MAGSLHLPKFCKTKTTTQSRISIYIYTHIINQPGELQSKRFCTHDFPLSGWDVVFVRKVIRIQHQPLAFVLEFGCGFEHELIAI